MKANWTELDWQVPPRVDDDPDTPGRIWLERVGLLGGVVAAAVLVEAALAAGSWELVTKVAAGFAAAR